MKTALKRSEIIAPVMTILFKAYHIFFSLGMHETLNQTIYRAIPVYPGNPLFELLRRKNNNPLPFPSI